MPHNQPPKSNKIKFTKSTKLGKEVSEKYAPKKEMKRKASSYVKKHVSVPVYHRFETCHSWMRFLTTENLDKKRLEKTDACGNRFCPICTWKTAKKDAIKLSVISEAIHVLEKYEYIFLTLTSPNVSGDNLREEINKFNHAISKLFRRKNVIKAVKGYVRKLEVTTDQEQYITDKLFKRKKAYFEKRGLKVGDPNPQYDTYNPHVHIMIAVNKSYFTDKNYYISQAEWLEMWQECMDNPNITQVDVRKVRKGKKSLDDAVLEVAKYTAKGNELYHSEKVFDVFYGALKGRQLLVYSGVFKEYAKKYKQGLLDNFKKMDDAVYTHFLNALWNNSKYEGKLRELTEEEFKYYNDRALLIDENDDIE